MTKRSDLIKSICVWVLICASSSSWKACLRSFLLFWHRHPRWLHRQTWLGLGLYGIHGIQVARSCRSRLDWWNVHSTVQLVAHPHDSHDTAIVFQIVSKAGEDFHLKGRVGCRTPAERRQKRLHCEGTRSYKHVLSQRRYGRDVTVLRNSSFVCDLSSFRMEPKHSIHDSCEMWILHGLHVWMSFEARETLRSTWICAWLLRDSEAFETALFCSPRVHVRRFLLEWFFSRFSRSIIDISQSAGRKPGSTRIAQSQVTREIATCGSSDYISWLSARFPRDVSEWTRPDSRHKPQTFPHQKLTRKQLKLLDMCWTCVTCGYCIWSNDAEQFAWYDIHLCNWLHQETVWNYSTDLDSWFRGWHCGCSAVSRFIQDVRESKLSQLIHTVGRIFGACDQAYLSLNLGRTLILRLLQPDCPAQVWPCQNFFERAGSLPHHKLWSLIWRPFAFQLADSGFVTATWSCRFYHRHLCHIISISDVPPQTALHSVVAILDEHQTLVHAKSKLWVDSCFSLDTP